MMDWVLAFGQKVFAIPGLHAILAALGIGFAVTHIFTLSLPANMAIKTAQAWSRVIVFVAVETTALLLLFTPYMVAWATTVAILAPQFYSWGTELLYHWKPYLKPKVLLTAAEMQVRIKEPPVGGGE